LSIYDPITDCYNTICEKVQIAGDSAYCDADFDFDINTESNEVSFIDLSEGEPTTWIWEFGDGEIALEQHPLHTYEEDTLYMVKLAVLKPGSNCKSVDFDLVYLGDLTSLLGAFAYEVDSNNEKSNVYPVDFYGAANGTPAKWVWDFGDGTKDSTSINPIHEYTEAGTYNVCLTVSDPVIEQSHTTCMNVIVGEEANTGITYVQSASMNVYPNPNNGQANIVYSLPAKDRVEVKVYDLLGNVVEVLVSQEQPMGIHTLNWNNPLPAGIYMVQLQTSNQLINHKVIINR